MWGGGGMWVRSEVTSGHNRRWEWRPDARDAEDEKTMSDASGRGTRASNAGLTFADASSSPAGLRPATPVVADHTSVVGVSDESRGRLRRHTVGRPDTALAPHMINKGVSAKGISRTMLRSEINPDCAVHNKEVRVPRLDKGKAVERSPSAPADVSSAGRNVTLSEW